MYRHILSKSRKFLKLPKRSPQIIFPAKKFFTSSSNKPAVENVVIMGAAGRDFHNFNMFFRGNPRYNVVAFTATQIPGIDGRKYPPELSGSQYPKGIPILAEDDLEKIIFDKKVNQVVFLIFRFVTG